MNSKQILLSIIMDAIDNKDTNIALLYKHNNRKRNSLIIEPMENYSDIIIIDISENYDNDLCGENKSIISAVSFTDTFLEDPDNGLLYTEILEVLKQNVFRGIGNE